ncbi:MAG: type I pullulanase [Bacilli bacterium]|nr:type I pullulanase [Bacilli bacterium]
MNPIVTAELTSFDNIRVTVTNPHKNANYIFILVTDVNHRHRIDPTSVDKKETIHIYEFKLNYELELGFEYHIAVTNIGTCVLNVNPLALLPDFDTRFYYNGDDLGVTYSHRSCKFALWAPLASSVILALDEKDYYPLKRDKHGVYRLTLNKNLKGHTYVYYVTNSGVTTKTIDPYAKASTINSGASVILDLNAYERNMNDKKLTKMNSYLDAIIYEGSVRDLTVDPSTNIKNKGKFLGLAEEKRVNKDGLAVGLDYIASLGITHLQLLPIYDFATTDEAHPQETYNWGYDPIQYFVPEGSYASKPNDPASRIEDLLTLISKVHNRGIRVVMDVVFNHVYEHLYSPFEAVVPNYYFRRLKDGNFFNASGCGNDLATERLMVRKMIIDACKWWASYYHIDGFRFDLMGLIDAETINKLREELKRINPNIILYGEGWNMISGDNLTLANSDNYLKMPNIAFFNDWYRDTVIGNLHNKEVGFGLDNVVYRQAFKEVGTGSTFNLLGHGSRFNSVDRTVNYVECHDNNTLFDKIQILRPNDTPTDKLQRVSFVNSLVLFSFGIPFFHAGQEIGLSKGGDGNSYRSGDKVNMFNYALLKERAGILDTFKFNVAIRKNLQIYHSNNNKAINNNVSIYDVDNGGILLTAKTYFYRERDYYLAKIFINPSLLRLEYKEDNKITIVPPMSILVEKGNKV